jgi:hypothetical protein
VQQYLDSTPRKPDDLDRCHLEDILDEQNWFLTRNLLILEYGMLRESLEELDLECHAMRKRYDILDKIQIGKEHTDQKPQIRKKISDQKIDHRAIEAKVKASLDE